MKSSTAEVVRSYATNWISGWMQFFRSPSGLFEVSIKLKFGHLLMTYWMKFLKSFSSCLINSSEWSRQIRNLCADYVLAEYFLFSSRQPILFPLKMSVINSMKAWGSGFSILARELQNERSRFFNRIRLTLLMNRRKDCTYFMLMKITPPVKYLRTLMKWTASLATVDFPIPFSPSSVINRLPFMTDSTKFHISFSRYFKLSSLSGTRLT